MTTIAEPRAWTIHQPPVMPSRGGLLSYCKLAKYVFIVMKAFDGAIVLETALPKKLPIFFKKYSFYEMAVLVVL